MEFLMGQDYRKKILMINLIMMIIIKKLEEINHKINLDYKDIQILLKKQKKLNNKMMKKKILKIMMMNF